MSHTSARCFQFGLLTLLLAVSACGRTDRPADATENEATAQSADNWLQISTDPAELQQARQLAEQQQSSETKALLEQPEQIWFVDEETQRLLQQSREQVVPKLLSAGQSTDPQTRIRAASLLIRLGDARGRDVLLRELQSQSLEARLAVLHEISSLHEYDEDQPHLRFVFAAPGAAEHVLRTLDDPDERIQRAAIQACGIAELPGHVEKFRQLIHRAGYADRGRIAYWLGEHGEPAVDVENVAQFFREGMAEDDVYSTVQSLTTLADRGDDQVVARVLQLVREYYARTDLDQKKLESSVGWQLTSLLASRAEKDSAPWLRSQLDRLDSAYQKGDILRAYARIEGSGWRDLLFSSLPGDLKPHAAAALGDKLAGTRDAEAVQKLSDSLQDSDQPESIAAVCEALIKIGGNQAHETVARWADRSGPWQRMDLMWKLNGWTLDSAKSTVVASGLMSDEEYDAARAKLEQQSEEERPDGDLIALLHVGERMLIFDVETGELPCRHDQLLHDFAAISNRIFVPEYISQQWNQRGEEDFEADYTLRFVYDGRLYQVRLQNLGDWYDVERLVIAANKALEQSGRQERFVPLHSDGQIAHFVFGKQQAIASLAESLKLPIDDDLTRAMRGGQAFEERVLEEYRKRGDLVE